MDQVSYSSPFIACKLLGQYDWESDDILQNSGEIENSVLSCRYTDDSNMFKADTECSSTFSIDGECLLLDGKSIIGSL